MSFNINIWKNNYAQNTFWLGDNVRCYKISGVCTSQVWATWGLAMQKKPWDFCSGCNLQQKRINLNCMSNIYFPSHYMFDKIGYDTSSLSFSYLADTTQKLGLHPLAQYTKSTTQKKYHIFNLSLSFSAVIIPLRLFTKKFQIITFIRASW